MQLFLKVVPIIVRLIPKAEGCLLFSKPPFISPGNDLTSSGNQV